MPKRKLATRPSGRTMVMVPITELQPYKRNARTHTDKQIEQVIASIKEFGWTNPVLIDEKRCIIAGHARVEAAKRMGTTEVPCIILDGLTEAQKRAYVIADNKLALNAGWDEELLALEFIDLQSMDFNLNLTGFASVEISQLIGAGSTNVDPDTGERDISEKWLVLIECLDEMHQTEVLNQLEAEGLKCRALIS